MPRKYPFETAARDVARRRFADHERYAVTLGDRCRRETARRLIRPHQYVDFVLRDQSRCELLGERRVALMIDEDKLELGSAHVWQAGGLGERQVAELRVRVVDDIGGDFGGGFGGLPGRRALPVSGQMIPILTGSAALVCAAA